MIKSFTHKGLKIFFESGNFSKIQSEHRKKVRLILSILNAVIEIKDFNFPGSGLYQLKGEFKDYWSVSVGGNWRIIFKFIDRNVFEVDYLDYH